MVSKTKNKSPATGDDSGRANKISSRANLTHPHVRIQEEYRKFPGRLPKYKPPARLLINNKLDSGDSYFLHVRPDGTELRLKKEPKELANKTHLVTIINIEPDGRLLEEVRVKYPPPSEPQGKPEPYGSGWFYHAYGVHERTQNWRRRRQP